MQMMEDLKPLWLYSSRRKLHIPFNPSNKKKGARIELLTKDIETSKTLMKLPYIYNPKLFYSYYMNRNVMSYIDSSGIIDDTEEDEEEALIEATLHTGEFNKIYIDSNGSANDHHLLYQTFTKNKAKKYYDMFGKGHYNWPAVTVYGFNGVAQLAKAVNGEAIIQYGELAATSFCTPTEIFVLNRSAFSEIEDQEIDYDLYCKRILITWAAMNSSKNCSRDLATAIGLALSGQAEAVTKARRSKGQDLPDIISLSNLVTALYKDQRTAGLKKLIRTGDTTIFAKYKIEGIKSGIKDLIVKFAPRRESFVLENGEISAILEASVSDDQICVATDLHFIGYNESGDKVIIKPKSYVDAVINKQNKLTGKDGIFICLGDLFYKAYRDEYDFPKDQREFAKDVANRFIGKYKILVRGNHDRMPDDFYIKECGFTHVCSSLTYGNILFTHQPEIVPEGMINVHGHIHGNRQYVEGKPKGYIDVYTMNNQHCDTLDKILDAKEEYEKTIKQGSDINKVDPHLFIPGARMDLEDILKEMTIGEASIISNGNILLEDYDPAEDKTYRRTKSGAHNPLWFVKQFSQDIANTGVKRPKGDPTISGDYESLHPWLLSMVDKAKDIKRIQYLRSDAYQGANQLTKLAKNMRDVQNGTPSKYVDVKYVNKMLSGGNTPEKVEAHARWLKGEYLRAINKKAAELRKSGQYESAIFEEALSDDNIYYLSTSSDYQDGIISLKDREESIRFYTNIDNAIATGEYTDQDKVYVYKPDGKYFDRISETDGYVDIYDNVPLACVGIIRVNDNSWEWIERYSENGFILDEISSKLDGEFKSKNYLNLSSFKSDNIKNHKGEFSHIRDSNDGEAFYNKNELVGFYAVETKDDGIVWCTALEISKDYQGHGLSKQFIDRMISKFNVTDLSVNKRNEVAISVYKKYGFKIYKETDAMLFMTLRKSINESYDIKAEETESKNPNDTLSTKAIDIVFYDKDIVIGSASISSIDTDNQFLYNFEVNENLRGQGYGTAILNYIGKHYSVKELTVAKENYLAIKLYKRFGFRIIQEFKENDRDMVFMRRPSGKTTVSDANESIEESSFLESDGNHGEAIRIYAAMNDKDRDYLAGGYDFVNMPNKHVIYRHVIRNNILDLKGFIEVTADGYCEQRSGTTGSVIIGVHPRHRGEGIGTELVKTMLKEIKKENPNLSNLVWRVENSNKNSYKLAEKNGFKLVRKQSTRSMLRYSFTEEKEYKDLDSKILNENDLAKKMSKFKITGYCTEGDKVRSIKDIEKTMSGTSFDAAYLTSCYLQRMGLFNVIMAFIEINNKENYIVNTHFYNVASYDLQEFFILDCTRKELNGRIGEIASNPNSFNDFYISLYMSGKLHGEMIPGVGSANFTNMQYNEINVGIPIYEDGGAIVDPVRALGEGFYEKNTNTTSNILERSNFSKLNHVPLPTSMISEAYRNGLVDDGYKIYKNYLIDNGNQVAYFFETDEDESDNEILTEADKTYDTFLRRYLFRKRLKNGKALVDFYNSVKESNPNIKKTYIKLKTYSGLNIFVDYSYYNGLFLTNCNKIKDYAVKMYWDFMNRLLDQTDGMRSTYPYSVVFVPVMPGAWNVKPRTYVWDYKQNINPISVIFRMLKTNPEELRMRWGNKKFLFVSNKGYFTLNFATLDYKNISKLKRIVNKLMSGEEIVEDEEEDGYSADIDEDTPAAIAVKVVDKIEDKTGIAIDNLSPIMKKIEPDTPSDIPLMRIRSDDIDIIDNIQAGENERYGIGILAPDEDSFADVVNRNNLKRNFRVDSYYIP